MLNRSDCKLSIIVPVYNVEQYIKKCLTSLLQIACKEMEILCIDDGSTDRSRQECEKFALQDKRIKVIHQENKGLPSVRNKGLSIAIGEYISFVDSDDWVDNRFFEDLMDVMDKNPNIDLSIGGTVREYPDSSTVSVFEKSSPRLFSRDEALKEMISGRIFFWYMWGKVYRRKLFEGFFADETVTTGEDLDSLWQIFHSGKIQNIWYSPKYRYHYYYNLCGMTEGKKRIERYKSDLYVFEKILKNGDKEDKEILDLIGNRAIQSIYSILREYYFLNKQFECSSIYMKKAISIIDKMNTDIKRKNTIVQRLGRMDEDNGYAKRFFENTFFSIQKVVFESKKYDKKYIYGTGIVSQYVTAIIKENSDFEGFVISDSKPSTLMFAGKPVYYLSDLSPKDEKVIILAVNRKNQMEIMDGLNIDKNTKIIVPDIPEDF